MSEFPTNETIVEPMPKNNGRFRRLVIGSTAVALSFLALVALLLWVDPFNWQVLARLTGRLDVTATAVPPQALLYTGVNLLEGNVEELQALRDTFAQPLADADLDIEETQQNLDADLAAQFGVTFSDDVQPWIGQYLGAAVLDVTLDDYGGIGQADWLLLAESRNNEAADAFLAKLAEHWATENGGTAVQESYDNVTLTVLPEVGRQAGFALARSGSLVLIGANAPTIQQAIAAQNGQSLADTDIYQTAVAQLPATRMLTFYLDSQQLTNLVSNSVTGFASSMMSTAGMGEGLRGTAFSITLTDDGIQLDSIGDFVYEELTPVQRSTLAGYAPSPALGYFPANTLMYAGAKSTALDWSEIRELLVAQLGSDMEAYNESMALFARDFGINPDTDIFPYISGEFALALLPGGSGLLAEQLDLPLEVVFLAGITDEAQIDGALSTLTGALTDPQRGGLGVASQVTANGFSMVDFVSTFDETLTFAYGSGRGYLVFSTSSAVMENLRFTGGERLADSPGYRAAQAAFAADMTPTMYVDMDGLMDTIRASVAANSGGDGAMMADFDEVAGVIRPLHTIASAIKVTDTYTHQTAILFIEK